MAKPLHFPRSISVRLSDPEYASVVVAARRIGVPPSVYVREVVRGDRPPVTERPVRRAQG